MRFEDWEMDSFEAPTTVPGNIRKISDFKTSNRARSWSVLAKCNTMLVCLVRFHFQQPTPSRFSPMDKRYQVFVSSTYTDLKDERKRVTQTLMEMDCIPAGMELFPALDEDQWAFIQRVIKDCDYYLLIIGGKYGSLSEEGISYTEKEYDYAVSLGIKVIGFVHGAIYDLPVSKAEGDPQLRKKLEEFTEKVKTSRLVKFWREANELPGLVALSLSKTMKIFPAVGWIRANSVASEDALIDLNDLRKENEKLRERLKQLEKQEPPVDLNLAGLDEKFSFKISTQYYPDSGTQLKQFTLLWSQVFSVLAPTLVNTPSESFVKNSLSNGLYCLATQSAELPYSAILVEHDFQTIQVQLLALGLVDLGFKPSKVGAYWSLTSKGSHLMFQLRTVKSTKQN